MLVRLGRSGKQEKKQNSQNLGPPFCVPLNSSGRVNAAMIEERLFPPAEDHIVLMCGPPPMLQLACDPALDQLGYPKELRFKY